MTDIKNLRTRVNDPQVILSADGIDEEDNLGYSLPSDVKPLLGINNFSVTGLSSPRVFSLPDQGGAIALTSSNITGTASNVTGIVSPANGGTGINNGTKTITLGGNLTTSGAFPLSIATTGNTNVTLPTSGTLAVTNNPTFTGTANFENITVNGTIAGSGIVSPANGGTGVNNGTKTITLGNDFSTLGNYPVTLTVTDHTNVTLPTSGTLAVRNNPSFTGTANFENINTSGTITGSVSVSNLSGVVSPTNGGTGVNNGTKTITLGDNLTTSGAFPLTLNTTANTSVTLPTSGTLAVTNNPSFTGTANFAGNVNIAGLPTGIPRSEVYIPTVEGEKVSNVFFVSTNGTDHPDVSDTYKTAANLVKTNRSTIINTAYLAINPPSGIDPDICKRDIGYFVDAIAADLGNSNNGSRFRSNLYSIQSGKAYYELDGTLRISTAEKAPTIAAFTSVASQVVTLIGSGFAEYINGLRDIVNGYLNNGLGWASAPDIQYGVQRGRFIDGSNLIKANRDYIVNQVLADLQAAPYNYSLPTGTKCARDLNFILDAVVADLVGLSNVHAIAAGLKYFEDGQLVLSTSGASSELTKTITAFTLLRNFCIQAIQNKLPNLSNIAEVRDDLNPSGFATGASQYEGSECASVANTAYTLVNIVLGYLENGIKWVHAPKPLLGLGNKQLPGRSWSTSFRSVKRALADVAKFPGKECTVRVSSGRFYEDNPLVIPQPKTAVVGDNLRTTTICPLNHGQDLFKVDSGTYLNYLVFEDNYLGGFGVLNTSNQSNPRELSATATTLSLFPGHTIKDVPGRFKDAANLIRANRDYIDGLVADYNALPILDAVIADLRINGNINAIAATTVNNLTKINEVRDLIFDAIENKLPNEQADETDGTVFNALAVNGSQYDSGLCANVKATASTLVDIIAAIAAGGTPPSPNTGTLILIDQEWVQIASINGNDVILSPRGGILGTSAARHINGAKCTQGAKAFRYAAAFKNGTNIFLSPYIQNCSNISVLGKVVTQPDGTLDDTKTLAGGILVDGGVLSPNTPIASMVMDAFTQIVSGSVGFHHKNDGYSQLVSVFTVFDKISILCESGAYTSVTNSATNFGNEGLKAVGFSSSAFPFYKGNIQSAQTVNLDFNATPSNIESSSFAAVGNQTRVTLVVEAGKISQFVVGQTVTVSGHSVTQANGTGLVITAVQASDRTISYLVNTPFNNFPPGGETGTVQITFGRQVTKLSISGFTSVPLPNYVVKVDGAPVRGDGIEYVVESATPIQQGITVITLQAVWEGTLPISSTPVELRRPSTVNSSSHTFEFVGSGINYTALPENGGITNTAAERIEVNAGRVYCSATDQDGNFSVGPFFSVDLASGAVTFAGSVSLGVIDEIQLKNSPGVPIRQFSINTDLDGDAGASNFRIATQRATRDFVKNKLGNLFNKTSGTSGGSATLSGQLVELNSQGFIDPTQLPPRSPFNVFQVANEAARLALTGVNQGDYAVQADNNVVYVLKTIANNGAANADNWAILPTGVVSSSDIVGTISTGNLGTGTANANTFLSGNSSYLPVVRSLIAEGAVSLATEINAPGTYPNNARVGDITIGVNTVAYADQQTSGSSSLGVAKFAHEDFDINNGVVSIKDHAVDLSEIQQITGNSVLGNDTSSTGLVRTLPLNEVVSKVSVIAVTYDNTNSKYTITVNGINLGNNPTLYLTPGETYNFNLNVVGHGFYLVSTSGVIASPYTTGLQGTPGTEVTNSSTKFIWTVPLNAPSELFYQDGVTLGNFGKIAINPVGTSGRIAIADNVIDLATVTQTDTSGTAGINFVQSIAKDSYGRVTGRIIADIRTASTSQTGIVQLNSATNSTSTTQAATPSAVKTAYDLAALAIPTTEKAANNGVATLGGTGKIPKTQIELVASDVGAIALTEKAANNGVATLGGTGKIPKTQIELVASDVGAIALTEKAANNGVATLGGTGKIPKTQIELVASDVGAIASTEKGSNNGVATLGADGLIPAAQIPKSISRSAIASTSITLGVEHNGLIVETTATEAVTLTLPNNLPAGFNCIVVQKGAGQITFTAASDAILRHPDNHSRSARQYSSCTLYVSTNTGNNAEYILAGNTGV